MEGVFQKKRTVSSSFLQYPGLSGERVLQVSIVPIVICHVGPCV